LAVSQREAPASNELRVIVGGQGRDAQLLCERFGPVTFSMALVVEAGRLPLVPRRWSCSQFLYRCGFAHADAYECVEAGRFSLHVGIRHPLTGLIIRYRGALSCPEPAHSNVNGSA
jgi:hypothetical protein